MRKRLPAEQEPLRRRTLLRRACLSTRCRISARLASAVEHVALRQLACPWPLAPPPIACVMRSSDSWRQNARRALTSTPPCSQRTSMTRTPRSEHTASLNDSGQGTRPFARPWRRSRTCLGRTPSSRSHELVAGRTRGMHTASNSRSQDGHRRRCRPNHAVDWELIDRRFRNLHALSDVPFVDEPQTRRATTDPVHRREIGALADRLEDDLKRWHSILSDDRKPYVEVAANWRSSYGACSLCWSSSHCKQTCSVRTRA